MERHPDDSDLSQQGLHRMNHYGAIKAMLDTQLSPHKVRQHPILHKWRPLILEAGLDGPSGSVISALVPQSGGR